jgi:CHRD domain
MTQFRVLAFAVAALLPVAAACSDDNSSPSNGATSFTADLRGANEVPPVTTTPATGTATLTLNGQQIEYTVSVSNITNPILAHIHIAPTGQNGLVRLNLCGTGDPQPACTGGTGVLATGTNGTTVGAPAITFDSLVSAMRTGGAYVNVHTNSEGCTLGQPGCNPGGEIRGQVQTTN